MAARSSVSLKQPVSEPEGSIVDLGFQSRALLPIVFFLGSFALLAYTLIFMPMDSSIAADPDLRLRTLLAARVLEIHERFWAFLAVAAIVAGYVSFYWSLRVVRPLYRLHNRLHLLAEGDYRPLRFRRGEEFRFFGDDLAQLHQKMKLIAGRNRDILLNVYGQLRTLDERLAAEETVPRADLKEVISGARRQLEKTPEIGLAGRR
ncbi:MAG: hypothetical protein ACE5HB_08845 [Terriglobia bacterium]